MKRKISPEFLDYILKIENKNFEECYNSLKRYDTAYF